MKYGRVFTTIALASALSACASSPPVHDPAYAPVQPAVAPQAKPDNGAIFQAGTNRALFEDTKARHIGDILTVVLTENTNASKSADTAVGKASSTSISNPTLLGQPVEINPQTGFPLAAGNWSLEMGLESQSDFEGDGESNQSNSLTGNIAVTVVDVLANGNLVIRGEKVVTLNQGDEFIRLAGIVRPEDVSPENSVASTKVANARITYSGQGAVADANKMGWLARFFTSALWPF